MSEVRMIDVGDKPVTRRRARAGARVRLAPAVVAHIRAGTLPEGRRARRGARRCDHGLEADAGAAAALPSARAHARLGERSSSTTTGVAIEVVCETTGQTGVEMEAMTACAVAALCVYDMTKGIDATGSDRVGRPAREGRRQVGSLGAPVRIAVLTVSDGVARRHARGPLGRAARRAVQRRAGHEVVWRGVLPDERDQIAAASRSCATTTRPTSCSRPAAPASRRATSPPRRRALMLERLSPGIDEALRADALRHTPHGVLSRGGLGHAGAHGRGHAAGQPARPARRAGPCSRRCSSTPSSCSAPSRRRTTGDERRRARPALREPRALRAHGVRAALRLRRGDPRRRRLAGHLRRSAGSRSRCSARARSRWPSTASSTPPSTPATRAPRAASCPPAASAAGRCRLRRGLARRLRRRRLAARADHALARAAS